jgi:EAL domain-containing protein (putative c-di-GMP-specific phosphodiesterase class I)
VPIAVNVSARQFNDDGLLGDLQAILAETGLAPGMLELELTEGMIIQNVPRAVALLTAMKQLGVRLAIDDFGTGYSSLGQLKNFPIDTLKVDRSFVRDLATNLDDQAITTAIIAMGRTLSLTVVAEGVETPEQVAFLRQHACNEMQGYYFSKPVDATAFAALLATHTVPEDC